MNHCLRYDCINGYGVFPGPVPFPYAQYGSFRYSNFSKSAELHSLHETDGILELDWTSLRDSEEIPELDQFFQFYFS